MNQSSESSLDFGNNQIPLCAGVSLSCGCTEPVTGVTLSIMINREY